MRLENLEISGWHQLWHITQLSLKKSLIKQKKCLLKIEESQKDVEQYEDKADHSIKTNDKEIKEADRLLATAQFATQQAQTAGGSEVSDQWTHFKPQQNLAPLHLEQGVTHPEVSKFADSMNENIHNSGFSWRDTSKGGLDVCCSFPGMKLVGFNELERSSEQVFGRDS